MRLGRLTGLEVHKLQQEIEQLEKDIAWYRRLLSEDPLVTQLIRGDLADLEEKYGEPRRTEIGGDADELMTEDLIAEEAAVVTVSREGFVKRTPASVFRAQGRGGRGIAGGKAKEGDLLSHLFVCSTHDYLLVVTDRGRLYWLKVWRLPDLDRTAKGRSIRNLVEGLQPDEEIRSILATRKFDEGEYLLFATANGKVKKTEFAAYSRPRSAGIIATRLEEGDRLIGTVVVSQGQEVLLASAHGQIVRFDEADARAMGRDAAGVKGAELREGDRVVALVTAREEELLLIACANGYGKRTQVGEFRLTHRGSQGVIGIKANERNGEVVNVVNASRCDEVLLSTVQGMMVRTRVAEISEQGRPTQGVRLVNLKDGDALASVAPMPREDEADAEPAGA
jgi:DNA gyrase subunit A